MADILVSLASLSDQPTYNIKAVCKRTGLTLATLRAWERRYGVPSPGRTENGYRLYSEQDVAILFWLKQQTENGGNIGQVSAQLHHLLAVGRDLQVVVAPIYTTTRSAEADGPRSPE